jgi:hypothetical protein
MSSWMYCARGPAFPVGMMLMVRMPFLGYRPHRRVPPQSITATATSSSGTDVLNPLTGSAPVSSAIRSTTSGLAPPPTM